MVKAVVSKKTKTTPKMKAIIKKKVAPNKSAIDVLITFDTTGSMYPVLEKVRNHILELTNTLFKEFKGIRVGILAHGDYCDKGSSYVTKQHKLDTDQKALIEFIKSVGKTGGGDAPECYELVLFAAKKFAWSKDSKKIVVMIGDDLPHGKHEKQNELMLDWREQLQDLSKQDIKVYGIQAMKNNYATPFWKEISETTGGFHLRLEDFNDIIDMLQGVLHQQNGTLKKFISTRKNISVSMKRAFGILAGEKKLELEDSKFKILNVKTDTPIKEFVESNGLLFDLGKGYYQFTKSVLVQKHKKLIILDKNTNQFYIGNDARKIMGMPLDADAQCKPDKDTNYLAFIQSTSVNRKLIAGTKFLYEI